jgi:hypothetical protein
MPKSIEMKNKKIYISTAHSVAEYRENGILERIFSFITKHVIFSTCFAEDDVLYVLTEELLEESRQLFSINTKTGQILESRFW